MARPFPQPLHVLWSQAGGCSSFDRASSVFDPALPVLAGCCWPLAVEPACECGAPEHPEESHEHALAAEIARTTPGCTCPGYCGCDGEPTHDGLCDLFEAP